MPKIVDHTERRRAIASAAVDAVGTHGLDGVKLADIAKAAGVTTGAIAHYFSDKDAVLAAALEEVCARLFAHDIVAERADILDQLADCLPVSDQNRTEWRVWLAYWGRAPFSAELSEVHRQYYLEIEAALAARLRSAVADPDFVAVAIIAAIDGIGTRATLEPDAWPEARQRRLLKALVAPLFSAAAPSLERTSP